MCIAVPAKVIKLRDMTAIVDFGGIKQEVNISLIAEPQNGDYLLIHCGCAIEKINQKAAEQTIKILQELTDENRGGEVTDELSS